VKVAAFLEHHAYAPVLVGPDETIAEAARRISEKHKGLACVSDPDGNFLGVISVIDIGRALREHGGACAEKPVSQFMNPGAITCEPKAPIETVRDLMQEHEIRHVPVVDGGKLVGLINIRDVLHYFVEQDAADIDFLRSFVFGIGYH
jgi:CBS domain-containing protein